MNSSEATPWNPCPSSPYGVQVFFIVDGLNILVGLPVNLWTVWLIGSHSVQPAEVFTLNAALLECLYVSLSFLRPLNYYVIKSPFVFQFNRFLVALLNAGRPLFQTCACLERYVGVVRPVSYLRLNSVRTRLFALPLVWTLVLLLCVCILWASVFVFPAVFLLLLLLQGFCCVGILQSVK